MNYYLKERDALETYQKNAGSKARKDVEDILSSMGYRPVNVAVPFRRNKKLWTAVVSHFQKFFFYFKQLHFLGKGDTILVQFPPRSHSVFFPLIYRFVRRKGAKVCILIHDIERLRFIHLTQTSSKSQVRIVMEELPLLRSADLIICHNEKMKAWLMERGIPEEKLILLGIFDYRTEYIAEKSRALKPLEQGRPAEVIIAGNLNPGKTIYLRSLQHVPDVHFNLYGVGFEDMGQPNVSYKGSYMPEELPGELEGHFGLVWDGTSIETCEGPFGQYLQYNDPHKLSLYLVSGLPVIIWDKAAMASFVEEHHLGLTVSSLKELPAAIARVSSDEYEEMVHNALSFSKDLREGRYLKDALPF